MDLGNGSTENKLLKLAELVGASSQVIIPLEMRGISNSPDYAIGQMYKPEEVASWPERAQKFVHSWGQSGTTPTGHKWTSNSSEMYMIDFSARFRELLAQAGQTEGKYWANIAFIPTSRMSVFYTGSTDDIRAVRHTWSIKKGMSQLTGYDPAVDYPAHNDGGNVHMHSVPRYFRLKLNSNVTAEDAHDWWLCQRVVGVAPGGEEKYFIGKEIYQPGYWMILADGLVDAG